MASMEEKKKMVIDDYLPQLGRQKVEIEFKVLQTVGLPEHRVLWSGAADAVPNKYRKLQAVPRHSPRGDSVILDLGYL